MKLWLDTDIRTDIDNAVCLASLRSGPDCELPGVTSAGRDPGVRALLTDAIDRIAATVDRERFFGHFFDWPTLKVAS